MYNVFSRYLKEKKPKKTKPKAVFIIAIRFDQYLPAYQEVNIYH